MNFQFDWHAALACIPALLNGLPLTLLISLVGVVIGMLLGVAFGLLRLAPQWYLRALAVIYVEVFRGTPVLVQVLFIFYGLPSLLGHPLDPLTASIAAIALNSGAYISEVVRGGVGSIDRGQSEAGFSLGLGPIQSFVYVIWPQALKRMAPALGNQMITSIKDTSLFSVIGIGELVREGQTFIAATFNALEVYLMIGVFYLIITLTLSLLINFYEKTQLQGRAR
ncbi:amine acid ABC transporter, permease protein, 3-TM region, His/Glu/Gln/Arg/opine family [Pseudomonas sp. GM49]|uniref:amino acid ABC transporter permease n=1 Tax=Pseudomonas sp. GM49 TaxID=1144331 RepID=UPI0002705972|nr:amino acid ABC transporter permease [Pseudomonas sp. GM49]EJM67406.1 amine acid ABC transporter, permease protein, 3-TM region, His/Glu/Gln/Arg/opine family [Pseudomonas sp. GM49]